MTLDPNALGIVGLVAFLGLVAMGVPMGFAGFAVGLTGMAIIVGPAGAINMIVNGYTYIVSSEALSVLPLFIIMGGLAVASGATRDGFEASRRWVGHLPGGLVATTSLTGAMLGAMCGSSMASTAILARILRPEIKRTGYDIGMMAGAISSVGGLAVMIPPSSLMVIYGLLTEASIRKLLMAGLLPGLFNALVFVALAVMLGKLYPDKLPRLASYSWKERLLGLKEIWAIMAIAIGVIGSIYSGLATATESAGIGVLVTLLVAVWRRTKWQVIAHELVGTATVAAKIFLIIAGMVFFARFMALTGLIRNFQDWSIALQLSPPMYLLMVVAMYMVLGCLLDTIGMLTLTLPFVFPIVTSLGYDPIWFGVFIVLVAEIGLITPPIGLNVFVAAGAWPEVPMATIFRGVLPYFFAFLLVLLVIVLFPPLSLFLPSTMGR